MSVPLFDKKRMVAIVGVGNKEEDYTDFDVQQLRIISQSMLRLLVRQREVKEQEKLQLKLRQASKMEAIGTLAGGIAHDFNNILGIIHGNADMAMEDIPPDSPVQKNIFRILQAAQRAKEIISQILLYSRQGETKLDTVNPCEMVDQTLELLRSTLPTTVKIKQFPCKEDVYIEADRTMFQQLLMNLFVNAADAMQEKGTITIRGEVAKDIQTRGVNQHLLHDETHFLLSVTDTGDGMSREVISRIFDPFFTTKQPTEGTGMGLSTVMGIVENHAGVIDVASEPGEGTTFYVYFPLATQEIKREIERKPARIETGNEHILFVDDEEMIIDVGKVMLEKLPSILHKV
jgi:signal transduction histidine kinase